ncbi:MAG: hypothetical protein ABJF11_02775, partial [Reichenbachiella sp.]|uniref:hypothetical protein n=1 Tax=Reichenbachiella sp. TaxID=2184521 RepID=UPI003265FA92
AQVTDNVTGCTETLNFTITEDLTDKPVIDITADPADVDVTEVSACSGSAIYPNGEIDLLNVTTGIDTDEVNDFTYVWYIGSDNTGTVITDGTDIATQKGETAETVVVAGATTNHITGLDAGFYTVEATNIATGCTSLNPTTIEVTESIAAIVINASVDRDDYSCDISTPTGIITADVNGGNVGFTLDWYAGTSTAGTSLQQSVDATNSISNLAAGTYTVKVTDNTTNCIETTMVTIIRSTPTLSFTDGQTPQTNCTPNGEATVTPNAIVYSNGAPIDHGSVGNPLNYTYEWYEGQVVVPGSELAETTGTLSGQVSGYYTVVATENTSGCISNPVTIEIVDGVSANEPTALISTGTNDGAESGSIPTSCTGLGGIVADITVNPTGNNISFEWYEGSEDYANNPGTPLSSGTGQLTAPNNGVNITVSTTPGTALNGYAALTDIPSGLYTLVMIDGTTQCRSQEVFDLSFLGQQATTTIAIKHVEACPDDGQATVGLSDNISITYSSLVSTFEDGEVVIANPSGAVGVIYNDNGASSMDISTTSGVFTAADDITGQTSLATADIDAVTNGYLDGEVDDISEYDIYLYAGDGVPADKFTTYFVDGDPYPVIISGAAELPGAEVTFNNLPAGTYTAVAREKSNPAFNPTSTSRCFSASATDEIEQRSFAPIIESNSIVDNTICDFGTFGGDGSITVIARKDAEDVFFDEPEDFEFRWFVEGAETDGSDEILIEQDETTSTLPAQDPGNYVLKIYRIVDNSPFVYNGCLVEETYTIQHDPEIHELSVDNADITHIVDCNTTGSVSIVDARITDNAADYTYTWYKDIYDAGNIIGGQTSATLSGQTAGTYFVEATHNTKGCLTPEFEFEIEDQTTLPVIVFTIDQEDTFCGDPLTLGGNGQITANVQGQAAADYTFEWFYGSGTGTTLAASGIATQGTSGTNGQT